MKLSIVLASSKEKQRLFSQARRKGGLFVAIYSFNVKMISRGNGQNVIASSAYRSGEKLKDYATGEIKRFKTREIAPENHILAPERAPSWVQDREQLWNAVETSEKRVNSQLARSFMMALPNEFTHAEQREVILNFARKNFVEKGMITDIAIHRDDENNPHAHILTTTRHIDEQGFTTKERAWNDKSLVENWRKDWEVQCNKKLVELGFENKQISSASYEERGSGYLATLHLGYKANAMKLRGVMTERALVNEQIIEYNTQIKTLNKEKVLTQQSEFFERINDRTNVLNGIKLLRDTQNAPTYVSKEIISSVYTESYKELNKAYFSFIAKNHDFQDVDGNKFFTHLQTQRKAQETRSESIKRRASTTIEKRASYMQFLENQRGFLSRTDLSAKRLKTLDKRIRDYEKKFFGLGVILYSKNIQKALIESRGILNSKDVQRYIKFTEKHKIHSEKELDKALLDSRKKLDEYKVNQEKYIFQAKNKIEKIDNQITKLKDLWKAVGEHSELVLTKKKELQLIQDKLKVSNEKAEQLQTTEKQVQHQLEQKGKPIDPVKVQNIDKLVLEVIKKHERVAEIAPFIPNEADLKAITNRYDKIIGVTKQNESVHDTFQKQIERNNNVLENESRTIETLETKIKIDNESVRSLYGRLVSHNSDLERYKEVTQALDQSKGLSGKLKMITNKESRLKNDELLKEKETLEKRFSKVNKPQIEKEIQVKSNELENRKKQLKQLQQSPRKSELEKDNEQLQQLSKIVEPFKEQQREITKEIERQKEFERSR